MNNLSLIRLAHEVAIEIESLLNGEGETALAASVRDIEVKARCKCEDDNCSSFWTSDVDEIPFGTDRYRQVILITENKCYCLDIADEKIVYVEVVHQDHFLHDVLLRNIRAER